VLHLHPPWEAMETALCSSLTSRFRPRTEGAACFAKLTASSKCLQDSF
jgi:hypothetical protein